jgi:type III pantothenate kinase
MDTIAIDIGNTYTKIGLIDRTHFQCIKKASFPSNAIAEKLVRHLDSIRTTSDPDHITIVFASTKKSVQPFAEKILLQHGISRLTTLETPKISAIRFNYDNVNQLGVDRVAAALYCQAAFPGTNSIIIGAGTAITVDYLQKGTIFQGGAILPGVTVQLQSLHTSTDALPLVSEKRSSLTLPATSTESCIYSGVLYGIAGSIKEIIGKYRRLSSHPSTIVVSGGSWQTIAPLVDFSYVHIPDLVVIGTGLYEPVWDQR